MFWLIDENDTARSNGGLNLAFKIWTSNEFLIYKLVATIGDSVYSVELLFWIAF
jgi:hypothetical protein